MKRLISLILTLAMFMGIIATGGVFAASAKLPFEDVNQNDWFYSSVKYVFENEIMKGTEGNLFAPEVTLSRAMAVALLHRVDGEPTTNSAFTIFLKTYLKAGGTQMQLNGQ